jgi:hypothetical protein
MGNLASPTLPHTLTRALYNRQSSKPSVRVSKHVPIVGINRVGSSG